MAKLITRMSDIRTQVDNALTEGIVKSKTAPAPVIAGMDIMGQSLVQKNILQSKEYITKVVDIAAIVEKYPQFREHQSFLREVDEFMTSGDKVVDITKTVQIIYSKLRSDGLIKKTLDEAVVELQEVDPRVYAVYATMITMYSDCFKEQSILVSKINWMRAIEVCIIYFNRTNLGKAVAYLPTTEAEWRDFYCTACLVLLIPHLFEVGNSETLEKNKKLTAENENLRAQIQRQSVRIAREDEASARKPQELQRSLRATIAEYNQIIRAQEQELEQLRAELKKYQVTDEPEIEFVGEEELVRKECPLPRIGVTVAGVTPELNARLSELYPDWDLIDSGAMPDSYPQNDICFVCTDKIPHKQFYHLKANSPCPLLYVTGTNIQLLTERMRETYSNYVYTGRTGE